MEKEQISKAVDCWIAEEDLPSRPGLKVVKSFDAYEGMDEDEIEGDEEVHDVVGELSNMIGGDLKSRLCDAGLTCELSIPTITSGKEFQVQPKGWTRHERFVFHC